MPKDAASKADRRKDAQAETAPAANAPAARVVPFELAHPPLEGVDALSSGVLRAFQTAVRLHRRLMVKTLAARGTHPGQAMCMRVLAANDGATQRDLADALHLSRPTVSKMLQAMEKAGVVRRRADAADQRLTRVELTSAGRALEKDLRAAAAEHVNETIGKLPEADRRELERLLDELAASITRAIAAPYDQRDEGELDHGGAPRP